MNKDKDIKKRNTKQRQMIYNAVATGRDHPSADDIYRDIHKLNDRVSKGTVYRNLNVLSESGEITHVRVPAADRYDIRLDRHYHIMCVKCGKVFDIPMEYREDYDSDIAEKTGFAVERHIMLFEGICPDCQMSKGQDWWDK